MKSSQTVYTFEVNSTTIDDRAVRNGIRCISMEGDEAAMDKKADKKLVSFRLPEDLLQDLRSKADYYGISVTELVCRLLRQGLEEDYSDRVQMLEVENRDLRQRLKQANSNSSVTHALLYPLQSQSPVAYSQDSDLEQRIERMESMLETLLSSRMNSPESGKRPKEED